MFERTLLAVIFFMLLPTYGIALEKSEKLVFEKNSMYQYISVIEDKAKNERYIRNNKREMSQGGISIDRPDKLLFEYTQMSFISLAFLDRDPKEVLFVGLGAGSMPRYFHKYYLNANVDIVEIDQDIVSVAEKYFYFNQNSRMRVFVDDGRIFIKRTPKKYDMIFLDAYQNEYIPFHLTTLEFLQEVKNKLNGDGVVVSNVLSEYRNKFFDSMVVTYRKVFPHVYIFKGHRSRNFIFVATMSSKIKYQENVIADALKIKRYMRMDIDFETIGKTYDYSSVYDRKSAKILTDDFAPVNLYKYQKSEGR